MNEWIKLFILLSSLLAVVVGLYAGWHEEYAKGAYFVALAIYIFIQVKL